MRTTKNRWGARLAAAAGALALTAVTLTAPASAAPEFGDIDQTTGSIIVHKHEHQTGTPVTGNPDGDPSVTIPNPISGVVFTAYPITDINLGTNAGWTAVAANPAITVSGSTVAVTGHNVGTGVPLPATDDFGVATSGTLPVGAYVVVETSAPNSVVDKAQPFIVTIPTPYNDGWVYNVNVFPKNGVAGISKSIAEQTSYGLGSTVSFPVTTDIPTIDADVSFSYYWVHDILDSRLTGGAVASVTIDGAAVDSDLYEVTGPDANGLLTVAFNQDGLTFLKTQGGKQLVTTFTGTVSSVGNGVITNTAYLNSDTVVAPSPPVNPPAPPTDPGDPNYPDPDDPDYPGIPSDEVNTNWGDLRINKVNATPNGGTAAGLNGAVFEIYAAADPYATDAAGAGGPTGSPISVNGATTFTSEDGLVAIAGLFVSDSENAAVGASSRWYVLKEITAPAGYVLPTGGAELTPVRVETGATATSSYDAQIENVQSDVPNLPLTGSGGTLLLTLIGGALVIAGGAAALVARKRKQNA